MDEIRNGESRIPIKILNKIRREEIFKRNFLEYVPAVYYSTHTARPFLLRGPQRGWEARGQLWRDGGGREKGAGVGRAGFSSERKGEVGTEEAQHCGGGIRGHGWTYSDARLGGGDDKGEDEREESPSRHWQRFTLRYDATRLLRNLIRERMSNFGNSSSILPPSLSSLPSSPSADLYLRPIFTFSVPGQFTRGPF